MNNFGLGLILNFTDHATSGINLAIGSFQRLNHMVESVSQTTDSAKKGFEELVIAGMAMTSIGNVAQNIGDMIITAFTDVVQATIEVGSTFEQTRITLGTLYKDMDIGEEKTQWMLQFAKTTPFDIDSLRSSFIGMKAMGIDASQSMQMASGETQSLMAYLGDLKAFRPDLSMDWITRGLRNAAGGTIRSLDMILDINSEQLLGHKFESIERDLPLLVQALGVEGMMKNLEGTWEQKLTNLSDALTIFLLNISDAGLFDEAKNILTIFSDALNDLTAPENAEKLKTFATVLSDTFSDLLQPVKFLAGAVVGLVDRLVEMSQTSPELLSFLTKAVVVFGGLALGTGVVFQMLGPMITAIATFGLFMNTVGSTGAGSALSLFGTLGKLLPLIGAVIGAFVLLKSAYDNNFLGFKDFINYIGSKAQPILEDVGLVIKGVFGELTTDDWYKARNDGLLPMIEGIKETGDKLKGFWEDNGWWIQDALIAGGIALGIEKITTAIKLLAESKSFIALSGLLTNPAALAVLTALGITAGVAISNNAASQDQSVVSYTNKGDQVEQGFQKFDYTPEYLNPEWRKSLDDILGNEVPMEVTVDELNSSKVYAAKWVLGVKTSLIDFWDNSLIKTKDSLDKWEEWWDASMAKTAATIGTVWSVIKTGASIIQEYVIDPTVKFFDTLLEKAQKVADFIEKLFPKKKIEDQGGGGSWGGTPSTEVDSLNKGDTTYNPITGIQAKVEGSTKAFAGIGEQIPFMLSSGMESNRNYAENTASSIITVVKDRYDVLPDQAFEIGGNSSAQLSAGIGGGQGDVTTSTQGVHDTVMTTLDPLNTDTNPIGVAISQGLVAGMQSVALEGPSKGIADLIFNTIKWALNINSPSKKTEWLGRNVVFGLIEGLKGVELDSFVNNMMSNMLELFKQGAFKAGDLLALLGENAKDILKSIGFNFGATYKDLTLPQGGITSGFGYRDAFMTDSGQMSSSYHEGIDYGLGYSTPVGSAGDGEVIFAGDLGGYGLAVKVDHGNGLVSLYAHLSEILTAVGAVVKTGDILGNVGSTGNSTGAHLHFGLYQDGVAIDPLQGFAKGTDNFVGGLAQVNESGGEIINLPSGSQILPNDKTVEVSKAQGRAEAYANIISRMGTENRQVVSQDDNSLNFSEGSVVIQVMGTTNDDLEEVAEKLMKIIDRKRYLKGIGTRNPIFSR